MGDLGKYIDRLDETVDDSIKEILYKMGYPSEATVSLYLSNVISISNSRETIEQVEGWDKLTDSEKRIILRQTVSWYRGMGQFTSNHLRYVDLIRELENLDLEYQVDDKTSYKEKMRFLRGRKRKLTEEQVDVEVRVLDLKEKLDKKNGHVNDNRANIEIQSKALDDTIQRVRHIESLLSDLKEDEIYRSSFDLDGKFNADSVDVFSSTDWAIVFYYLEMDSKEGNKLDRIKDFISKKSIKTVYGRSPSPQAFNANVLKIGKQITSVDKNHNKINQKVYPPLPPERIGKILEVLKKLDKGALSYKTAISDMEYLVNEEGR